MHSKTLKTALLVIGCSTLALFAGFGLGRMSQGNGQILIYGERAREEHRQSIVQDPVFSELDDRALLERIGKMKPLVKGGPLIIYLDETSGDYAVYEQRAPIVLRTTDGDETTMTYYGPAGDVSIHVDLSYKTGTSELKRCTFTTNGEGGVLGPLKHYYMDINGDGRFERFSDRQAGKFYELNGLQWTTIEQGKR